MIEKLYDDLMELYSNSGKEFLEEMAALLKARFPEQEHTIFVRGEAGDWKIAASTLSDDDEAEFLQKMVETEFLDKGEKWLRFSQNRHGVLNHAVLPLSVRNKPAAGVWILESLRKEKGFAENKILKTAQMMALLVQTVHDEKLCIYNRYLDAETDFPGRLYFRQMLERLKEKGYRVLVCVLRRIDYREEVRLYGSQKAIEEIKKLADMVEELNFGTVFTIAEDTFAVLTVERQAEAYAGMIELMEKHRMGSVLQGLILSPKTCDDILMEIENRFCMCSAGRVLLPEPVRSNPLSRIFGEPEGKPEKASAKHEPEELPAEAALPIEEEDFMELLERSGNL